MPPLVASTFGIEEEFFLTELGTRRIPRQPHAGFAKACQAALGERFTGEMFASQFEVVTPVLQDLAQARACLGDARVTLAQIAGQFGYGIVAAGTHPVARWRDQQAAGAARYQQLFDDFQMVAGRSVLAGLHVHVAVPEGVDRICAMNRVTPWLPMLLALSASSPFWSGAASGLMSYRQAVCDEWPRMGIPDHFASDADYQRYVQLLLDTGSIRSRADVWWNIRPSLRYPTLELRIADACPRLEDALCVAALFRAMLTLAVNTAQPPWLNDPLTRVITLENRWRAKRHGVRGEFIDPASRRARPFAQWLEEVLGELQPYLAQDPDAAVQARRLAHAGSSAEQQLHCYRQALADGGSADEALVEVVDLLMAQTAQPLA